MPFEHGGNNPEFDSVDAKDATASESVTYPDGITHTASPIGSHIETKDVSAVTTVEFDLTGFVDYILYLREVLPATGGEALLLQFSEDGGSTWVTANYTYSVTVTGGNGTDTLLATQTGSGIQLMDDIGADSIRAGSGIVHIYDPGNDTTPQRTSIQTAMRRAGGVLTENHGAGHYQEGGGTAFDACRLIFSSGDISTAKVSLYGVSN